MDFTSSSSEKITKMSVVPPLESLNLLGIPRFRSFDDTTLIRNYTNFLETQFGREFDQRELSTSETVPATSNSHGLRQENDAAAEAELPHKVEQNEACENSRREAGASFGEEVLPGAEVRGHGCAATWGELWVVVVSPSSRLDEEPPPYLKSIAHQCFSSRGCLWATALQEPTPFCLFICC